MRKLIILGGGISGTGSAILGKKQGFDVFLSDKGKLKEADIKLLQKHGISFEEEKHTEEKILKADWIIKSPGIPKEADIIQKAIKTNITISSEIEFAAKYTDALLIGITGSNGKTTTTSLTYHILKEAGLNVGLAGNIGRSFALQVAQENFEYYVLEISSFQLDDIQDFKPHIAMLLNYSPDHLNRYDYKYENYINAKYRITKNQDSTDFLIYNKDDKAIIRKLNEKPTNAHLMPFSLTEKIEEGAFSIDNHFTIKTNKTEFEMKTEELSLQGRHNIANSMASGIAAKLVNIKNTFLRQSLTNFESVEHRLEKVSTVHGISFINDSKATNVNSVYYALESMKTPIVWIVGGEDKGNDYSELLPFINKKVKAIVCLGVDNKKIMNFFNGIVPNIVETKSMKDAVNASYAFAQKGDTVLLSPACASFDLFKNYEERGILFKQEVNNL